MALRPLGKLDCTEPIGQIRLYTGEGTPTPVLPRWARWIFERGAKGGRFAATAQKFEITGGFRGGGYGSLRWWGRLFGILHYTFSILTTPKFPPSALKLFLPRNFHHSP